MNLSNLKRIALVGVGVAAGLVLADMKSVGVSASTADTAAMSSAVTDNSDLNLAHRSEGAMFEFGQAQKAYLVMKSESVPVAANALDF